MLLLPQCDRWVDPGRAPGWTAEAMAVTAKSTPTAAVILHGSAAETVDRLNAYFNTAVFTQPAPFTFGNVSRTLPDVRAPGIVNWDFSALKNTRVYERATMQLLAEFFNFLNDTNFGGPGTTSGTASFGVISSAADARVVQLALKFLF